MVEIGEVKLVPVDFFQQDRQIFTKDDLLIGYFTTGMEMLCYGDVLFRRRCVTRDVVLRKRSITETICMETFCRGDV
jgi:hypothetical protein